MLLEGAVLMVRVIFLADSHLGFDYPVNPRIVRRRRGDDFFANFERILRYARESKPDFVVHGGDFFFRSKVPEKIIDKAYRILQDFAESGIPFIITPGNHERSRLPRNEKIRHPNIHIFTQPGTFVFNIGETTVAFSGFPFERKSVGDRFGTILSQTGWKNRSAHLRLLLMHQAVEGARVGPGNYTFRGQHDVVRFKDIPPQFNAALCGHIHRRQILIDRSSRLKCSVPVIYPGSIERTSFAERNEDKGFFELTFTAAEKRGPFGLEKRFLRLPSRPMFDIEIDANTSRNHVKSLILSQISAISPHAVVRFSLSEGSNASLKATLNSRFLRATLPETMNFQFGKHFMDYRNRQSVP